MVVLIPWHRFPPFERGKVGGLAVAVWELTREMRRQGTRVEVVVPGAAESAETTKVEGVEVTRSALGAALANNSVLTGDQEESLESFDSILKFKAWARNRSPEAKGRSRE
jgi:glycogen synthase